MSTIHPTHTCFDGTVEIMLEMLRGGISDLTIVHAIICPYGRDMAHAWVERDGMAVFIGVLDGERQMLAAAAADYRRDMQIKDETRYTIAEAVAEEKRTGLQAPWKDEYRRLTSDCAASACECGSTA